ncbi:MAG: hypothetical protein AAF335_03345 [Bacteroidota bacterium]
MIIGTAKRKFIYLLTLLTSLCIGTSCVQASTARLKLPRVLRNTEGILEQLAKIDVSRIEKAIRKSKDPRTSDQLDEDDKATITAGQWLQNIVLGVGVLNPGAYKHIDKEGEGYVEVEISKKLKGTGYTLYHLLLQYFYYGYVNPKKEKKRNKQTKPKKKIKKLAKKIDRDTSEGKKVIYTEETLKHMVYALKHHFGEEEVYNNYFKTKLIFNEIEGKKGVEFMRRIMGNDIFSRWLDDGIKKRKQKMIEEMRETPQKYADPASFYKEEKHKEYKEQLDSEEQKKVLDEWYEEIKKIMPTYVNELQDGLKKITEDAKIAKEVFKRYKVVWMYEKVAKKAQKGIFRRGKKVKREAPKNMSQKEKGDVMIASPNGAKDPIVPYSIGIIHKEKQAFSDSDQLTTPVPQPLSDLETKDFPYSDELTTPVPNHFSDPEKELFPSINTPVPKPFKDPERKVFSDRDKAIAPISKPSPLPERRSPSPESPADDSSFSTLTGVTILGIGTLGSLGAGAVIKARRKKSAGEHTLQKSLAEPPT